jgi:hypothetical protein
LWIVGFGQFEKNLLGKLQIGQIVHFESPGTDSSSALHRKSGFTGLSSEQAEVSSSRLSEIRCRIREIVPFASCRLFSLIRQPAVLKSHPSDNAGIDDRGRIHRHCLHHFRHKFYIAFSFLLFSCFIHWPRRLLDNLSAVLEGNLMIVAYLHKAVIGVALRLRVAFCR